MEKTTLVLVPDFTRFSCQIVMVQTTFFMGSLWYKNEEKKSSEIMYIFPRCLRLPKFYQIVSHRK